MNKILYYVIEISGFLGWERYREFSCNDYDMVILLLKYYRDSDSKCRYRLVGVFNV